MQKKESMKAAQGAREKTGGGTAKEIQTKIR
jgi:hypothetical protein